MPGRSIVVVGFSARGIAPLLQLVADLTPDFPATILVVHHFPAQSVSALPSILNRAGPLHATQPADGKEFVPGRIYVARPDRHLVIRDGPHPGSSLWPPRLGACWHSRGPRTAEDVPAALLGRYFERQDDKYVFTKELRRSVMDLIQDAPISRVNLLLCRNCLMYFNSEAQGRILSRFHFALAPRGVFFLGKAETLLAQRAAFEPLDVKRRVFTKTDGRPDMRHSPPAAPDEQDGGRQLRDFESDVGPVCACWRTTMVSCARTANAAPSPSATGAGPPPGGRSSTLTSSWFRCWK